MQVLQEIVITPLLETDAVREHLPVDEATGLDFSSVFENLTASVDPTEVDDTDAAITADSPEQEKLGSELKASFVAEESSELAIIPLAATRVQENLAPPGNHETNQVEPLENPLPVVEELDPPAFQFVPMAQAHLHLPHQHSNPAGRPVGEVQKVEGSDNFRKALIGEYVKGDAEKPKIALSNPKTATVRPAAHNALGAMHVQDFVKPQSWNLSRIEPITRPLAEPIVLPETSVETFNTKTENKPRRGSDVSPDRLSFSMLQPATPQARTAYQQDAKSNEAQPPSQETKSIQSEVPLKLALPITPPVPIEQSFKPSSMVNVSPNSGQVVQFPAAAVSQQIAIAVHQTSTGTTDITLNPEELGRVRLSMTSVDGTMMLAVATERAETQDLIRRHIETLAQEMRALGYRDVGFSFEQGQSAADTEWLTDKEAPSDEDMDDGTQTIQSTYIIASGLDLRL